MANLHGLFIRHVPGLVTQLRDLQVQGHYSQGYTGPVQHFTGPNLYNIKILQWSLYKNICDNITLLLALWATEDNNLEARLLY